MDIRRLQPNDASEYRALRLRALAEHPLAFTSSHEEEERKDISWYVARLADEEQRFLGAFDCGQLGGMVGLERRPRLRERHKATVVGLYVAPDHAGQGVGRELIDDLLDEARAMGLELLVLTVTQDNAQAHHLYESLGFQSFGVEPHAIKVDGRGYGKDHMFLKLTSPMSLSNFAFPTPIQFGPGARKEVAAHLRELGLARPLIVTDQALAALPVLAEFRAHLPGLEVAVFSGIFGNPTASQVMAGAAAFKAHGADCVIGFGGGAALDVAKVVGVAATHPGDIIEYAWDHPQVRAITQALPYFVALPTTSGTGSEVGRSSVVSENDTHLKRVVFSAKILAKKVFADPELTLGLPPQVTAATGMDALTHNIESYLSPAYHPLCDGIALEGTRIAARALLTAVTEPGNIAARSDMMMASMMGAIAFQKDLGAVHSCAHALGAVCDLHHGLANALMLDTVLAWNYEAVPAKFDELARVCNAGDGAAFVPWLQALKASVGITGGLAARGVKKEHIPRLVEIAEADICHQTNPRPCTASDFDGCLQRPCEGQADMSQRLQIGISACFLHPDAQRKAAPSKTLQFIEQSTAHWVMSQGALAFMVPAPSGDSFRGDVRVDDYAQTLDGLVLHGGADVWPGHYGEEPLQPEWLGDRHRDLYEMALVKAFCAAGKPVFGICRGLQLINVVHGGTLYQDIATQRTGTRQHRDAAAYDLNFHTADVVPGSRLAELLQTQGRVKINSVHHQAIKDLAPHFAVEAHSSEDGVIEAIRHQGAAWIAAVQWHPEFHFPRLGVVDDAPLLADFLSAAQVAPRRMYHSGPAIMTTLAIRNPANGQPITTLATDDATAVVARTKAARAAQPAWAARALAERKTCVVGFRAGVVRELETLAQTMTRETGKPITMSRNELNGLLGRIDFFLEQADAALAAETVFDEGGMREQIQHVPLGLVANISAWNYPWFVGCNVILPALLAGNAVLYKPSEFATLSGQAIARLLHEAGVPTDIMVCLVGDGAVGATLLAQQIDGVFFTGSVATGQKIAAATGGRFIKLQLELGGKDPTYVAEDADPRAAAQSLADGAMYNTGQSCCSVERIYVHEKIHDAFVEAFVRTVQDFRMGDPTSEDTYIGAITRTPHLKVLAAQVADAKAKGARLLLGGNPGSGPGNWFEATVFSHVNHEMSLMREETFGPLIGIQSVTGDDEAVRLMNDTRYGLTAGVYTRDAARAERLLAQVQAGTVYWNCCDRVSPRLPWSGVGDSGVGLTLSTYGIQTFTRPKAWHLRSPA